MNLPGQRIVVTGGAGFLGSFVIEALRARGVREVFVSRRRDYDLVDRAACARLVRDHRPDVVFHLTEFEFRTARVVGHGETRRESLDQADPWLAQYEGFGHYHTPGRSDAARSPDEELLLLAPNLIGEVTYSEVPQNDVAMSAPPPAEPFLSEPLTWEQICERYPGEWVCLVEMDKINDTDFDFRTARVVGHGKTRRAPLEQSRSFREQAGYHEAGHYFTRRPAR